jgi:hypothetical protein
MASWFTRAFTLVVPFVADVYETRSVKESGAKLFDGLAAKLKAAAHDPAKVIAIAETLQQKKGELTGAIVGHTPAAGLMDPEYMPPDAMKG